MKATSTDKLFSNLKKEGHDQIVLSSKKGSLHANPGVQTSNFLCLSVLVTPDQFASSLPFHRQVLIDAYLLRSIVLIEVGHLQGGDDMFLAIVWMTAAIRRLFCKFPYVLKLEVTFGVNS